MTMNRLMNPWQQSGVKKMNFITVEEAEKIILSHTRDYGVEEIHFSAALGRVLAEDLYADRDLPPFDRATVDGIAIDYRAYDEGIKAFKIKATQAAGETPAAVASINECIEIMTGAALHTAVNTVIRYEDILVSDGVAAIKADGIKKGQNVHRQGKDKTQGDKVADAGLMITPALTGVAASIGKTRIIVKKLPRVAVITTGDEMVSPDSTPAPCQLRRSNDSMICTALQRYALQTDTLHLKDDFALIRNELNRCLRQYDLLLVSGGVSMGKFDHVPQALKSLPVKELFHKVKQRPGKPLWFGEHASGVLIFAFPGNPVSVFLCLHRYFMPWLEKSLGMGERSPEYAVLAHDIFFPHPLQYFAQVKLSVDRRGQWQAWPADSNGSGDFSHLIYTAGFMELPLEKEEFKKGEAYRVWRYN